MLAVREPIPTICLSFEFDKDGMVTGTSTPDSIMAQLSAGVNIPANPPTNWADIKVPRLGIFAPPTVESKLPWYWYLSPADQAVFDERFPRLLQWFSDVIDKFAEKHPGSPPPEVYLLPGAPHYVYINNEAEVVRQMRNFLGTCGGKLNNKQRLGRQMHNAILWQFLPVSEFLNFAKSDGTEVQASFAGSLASSLSTSLSKSSRCQRRSKSRPLGRRKSRPPEALLSGGERDAKPVVSIGRVRGSGIADFAGIGIDNAAGILSELLSAARLGVLQAIGLAVHLKDMNVVGQPVEQRAG